MGRFGSCEEHVSAAVQRGFPWCSSPTKPRTIPAQLCSSVPAFWPWHRVSAGLFALISTFLMQSWLYSPAAKAQAGMSGCSHFCYFCCLCSPKDSDSFTKSTGLFPVRSHFIRSCLTSSSCDYSDLGHSESSANLPFAVMSCSPRPVS